MIPHDITIGKITSLDEFHFRRLKIAVSGYQIPFLVQKRCTWFENPILVHSIFSKFIITCPNPILVHFSIVWISDFCPDFGLTSSLDRNRIFEASSSFLDQKDPRVDSFDFQPSKMKLVLVSLDRPLTNCYNQRPRFHFTNILYHSLTPICELWTKKSTNREYGGASFVDKKSTVIKKL